jgi:hypothetical protein
MERQPSLLHVTNGDSAAHALRAAGMAGDILPWRDVLHEGPVPAGLDAEGLAAVRAVFLADCGWVSCAHALEDLRARDRRLAALHEDHEVVLWFEHDLCDQLQLIQVLDRIASLGPGAARVTMTCEPAYLGDAPPETIRRLHAGRLAVDAETLEGGAEAWAAFRRDTPEALLRLSEREFPSLPFLRAALVRLLEEYPAPGSGLGRTERQILEAVRAGATTPASAFRASQTREEAMFMGDATFFQRMDRLLRGPRPLLEWATSPPEIPSLTFEDRRFLECGLRLTDAGRGVLEGRLDHVIVNGIDRWIGGVRLRPGTIWRYDPDRGRLLAPSS